MLPRRRRDSSIGCRIFISYTTHQREDVTLANGLYECLVDCSLEDVFIDKKKLEWGDDWERKIDEAIAQCTHFVVFVSEAADRSDQVKREIDVASVYEDIKLLPVLLGDPRVNLVNRANAIRVAGAVIESLERDTEYVCGEVVRVSGRGKSSCTPPKEPPPHGRLAAGLCGREEAFDEVRSFLAIHRAEKKDQPAALFVFGRDEDKPGAFIDAMIETWVRPHVIAEAAAADGKVEIPWPGGYVSSSMLNGLKYGFLTHFGLPVADLSDDAFIRQVCALQRRGLMIVHTVRCSTWDAAETPRALTQYLQLWDRLGQLQEKPFVLLFFSVIYSDVVGGLETTVTPSAIRSAIASAQLPRSSAIASAMTRRDLPPITRDDVADWFKKYASQVGAETQKSITDGIFGRRRSRRMSDVEPELQRVVSP